MRILGIETSCDETAVCLIEAQGNVGPEFRFKVLGNALYSQIATHAPWGGVFPNLAKREHARNLVPLLDQVCKSARALDRGEPSVTGGRGFPSALLEREPELRNALEEFLPRNPRPDLDAIAVTYGPGLPPALWVGVNFARALSIAWDVPLVAVNHLEGHIAIAAMDHEAGAMAPFEFPLLALLVSGGHTELDLSRSWGEYETIGATRDDAVGEAFDKTARLLGIPYPGGAELSRLAAIARARGGAARIKFSRPMLNQDNFDFSFSGLKTEVRKHVPNELTQLDREEIACAFEDAAVDTLVGKTLRAAEEYAARTVVVGGGVSANAYLREQLRQALEREGIMLLLPPSQFSTDNALMIALAGYFHALKKEFADPATLAADGNLRLGRPGALSEGGLGKSA